MVWVPVKAQVKSWPCSAVVDGSVDSEGVDILITGVPGGGAWTTGGGGEHMVGATIAPAYAENPDARLPAETLSVAPSAAWQADVKANSPAAIPSADTDGIAAAEKNSVATLLQASAQFHAARPAASAGKLLIIF